MKPFIAVEVRGKACTRCMFRDASYAECCAAAAAAVTRRDQATPSSTLRRQPIRASRIYFELTQETG